MSAFAYTGSSFFGYRKDPTIDEFDRKQGLRHNRRRPIDETISELGEGRGKSYNFRVARHLADICRNSCTRLLRQTSAKDKGAIWNRCACCQLGGTLSIMRTTFAHEQELKGTTILYNQVTITSKDLLSAHRHSSVLEYVTDQLIHPTYYHASHSN